MMAVPRLHDLPEAPLAEERRRGACPTLSTPMMTGDGFLARIALLDAVPPAALAEIGRLAPRHGNGMIDISARGNVQIRGLSAVSAPELDADIRAMRLPLRDGLAVETPPFAGIDATEIADPRALSEAIRIGAREIGGLAPKMSVAIDGGGRLRLSRLTADIRLVAVETEGLARWKILLGGTEANGRIFDILDAEQAVEATLGLLRSLASRGSKARGRDLAAGYPLNEEIVQTTSSFGLHRLAPIRFAAGIGPAFGQLRADRLITLCEAAVRLEIQAVRPAPDHTLLLFGSEGACRAIADLADRDGFITSTSDPRGSIAACSGRPACRSASIETHAIAAQAAAECGDLLDGSFTLHVSGCSKGCAHPQPAALTVCSSADDVSLILNGKAGERAFAAVAFADTNAAIRHLADLVRINKRADETSAACLARLELGQVMAALSAGHP